ncbi:manganese efflux pump MntP [Carboxylicivirga taeanensis]|uniref:manganese efflux pump MntP n=1 Tax=Carboxylicivirga taeanensis TaxID=1416875 RepID=UPI003F6E3DF8
MDILTLVVMASALAMDSFAVSITAGISLKRFKAVTMLRISLIFALFQGLMPVLGWFLGINFVELICNFDHWVVFILLTLIGGKMVYEALQHQEAAHYINIYSNKTVAALGFATSVDALAVGFSFSLLDVEISLPAIIIGVTTFIFSFAGLTIGLKLGSIFRTKIELIGGIILIGIGIKVLVSHLLA